MHGQLKVIALGAALLIGGASLATANGEDPYLEPSPDYLRQFEVTGSKTFVLERFDAEGRLVKRSAEKLDGEVGIYGPLVRRIGGYRFSLRGLRACPTEKVVYNRVQSWDCGEAARDYADAVYNRRSRVILCKTLVLTPAGRDAIPASCFVLVGGHGEPFKTVNDDDSMVFLGFAAIGRTDDGKSRRPDLEKSLSLSQSMEFQNAD